MRRYESGLKIIHVERIEPEMEKEDRD